MGNQWVYGEHKSAYAAKLERQGYQFEENFLPIQGLPDDFPKFNGDGGWAWRRAINEWMAKHPGRWEGKVCKIVRATGYWKDLHGESTYEIWSKPK